VASCKLCGESVHFSNNIVSERTGKKIPLQEGTDEPHACEQWKAQSRRYYECKNCSKPIYFDETHKSKNDKFIPLDKETGQPHDCEVSSQSQLAKPTN
jgi:peptide methionine sulfoxide reductase MsrB